MKRLTLWNEHSAYKHALLNAEVENNSVPKALVQLAHYEDTGLTPDEINAMKIKRLKLSDLA